MRESVSETKKQVRQKKEVRHLTLAQKVLATAEKPDFRFWGADHWRVAQIDTARLQGCSADQLRQELAAALAEFEARPPAEASALTRRQCFHAGEFAFALFRLDAAESWYRQATAAPDDGLENVSIDLLHERLADILHEARRFDEEVAFLDAEAQRAELSGNPLARARAKTRRARYETAQSHIQEALELYQAVVAIYEERFG